MRIPIVVFVSATLLSACVPLVENIYKPSSEEGKLLESMCGYNNGPGIWDVISFTRGTSKIKFKADQGADGLNISVSISLPEGSTAKIKEPTIRLTSDISSAPIEMQAASYSWYDSATNKMITTLANKPMIGHTYLATQKYDLTYYIRFTSGIAAPNFFTISPPVLIINEEEIHLPPIVFRREKTLYFASLNC